MPTHRRPPSRWKQYRTWARVRPWAVRLQGTAAFMAFLINATKVAHWIAEHYHVLPL